MKLTLQLIALLGYVVHINTSVLQYEAILVHPGIIGGIFKGPNSETIIQGPDGSAITAEQIGGGVEIPDIPPSAALIPDTAVNLIPDSSTARPDILVTSTLSPASIEEAHISSTAPALGSSRVVSDRTILISNKLVPISSSGIEIFTLSPSVVSTTTSPQESFQPIILPSDFGQDSLQYRPDFTASAPAKVLLPPSSPASPSVAPSNAYQSPVITKQAVHQKPVPTNYIVTTPRQPVLVSTPGDLNLSTGYTSNVRGGSSPTVPTIQPYNEESLLGVQRDSASTNSIVQPEASIGVLQQQVTTTLPPVNLVPDNEGAHKSNIQRIWPSRPSSPGSASGVNDARQVSRANPYLPSSINSVPVQPDLQAVQTIKDISQNYRQNMFSVGNRQNSISSSEPPRIVSSTITPTGKLNWISNEAEKSQVLISAQQNSNVNSDLVGQTVFISSANGDIRQLDREQNTHKNPSVGPTIRPDLKIEPLNKQLSPNLSNIPIRDTISPEITVPRAPGIVSSTASPTIGSKQQTVQLSQLPNNKGVIATYNVGPNQQPQQILLEPLPDGAIELGATISSQTTVTGLADVPLNPAEQQVPNQDRYNRLGDVSPKIAGQPVPNLNQYQVYQIQGEDSALLSSTNPVAPLPSQNKPGSVPIDSKPLTFDIVPQNGVVLPAKNFDDSATSVLWNRYERSSERTR
ncbi:unnamed protein product [Acanthoscelides obtectus]|uniref:Uncharacterized protein n=1 Tax=Acanthoscelides obtectus TaxID=200917 RepID=A0A9P0LTF7_ACAOB|nr:unnamed protein product [Acanthoscelides obtectus]CAK1672149.1 hypothetical protein AOBTE_LOCUS28678 [Acanthoscelides obtectus]